MVWVGRGGCRFFVGCGFLCALAFSAVHPRGQVCDSGLPNLAGSLRCRNVFSVRLGIFAVFMLTYGIVAFYSVAAKNDSRFRELPSFFFTSERTAL